MGLQRRLDSKVYVVLLGGAGMFLLLTHQTEGGLAASCRFYC